MTSSPTLVLSEMLAFRPNNFSIVTVDMLLRVPRALLSVCAGGATSTAAANAHSSTDSWGPGGASEADAQAAAQADSTDGDYP